MNGRIEKLELGADHICLKDTIACGLRLMPPHLNPLPGGERKS
jgi:hypothetical protein